MASIVCFSLPLTISPALTTTPDHHALCSTFPRHGPRTHRSHRSTLQHPHVTACTPQFIESPDGVHSAAQPSTHDHHGYLPCESASSSDSTLNPTYDAGGGGGGGVGDGGVNNSNRGDSGGGNSGDDEDSSSPGGDDANSFSLSLPDDMKAALAYGSLTREALRRYHDALKRPFLRLLLAIPAFRSRFLADPQFLFKLLVQEVVGNGTALAGEIAVRGHDIVHELEYVASDLIVGTVIEAAFVWLLTPTLTLPPAASASWLSRYLASLPAHAFQHASALQSFSATQRVASFVYGAAQYAAIGFAGGVVGTAITYALLELRKQVDPAYSPARPMPPVIPNSLGWAAFMGVSCNTRFQLVEGLELAVAKLFARSSKSLVNGGIVALRFANNYYGGVQFVQFFRAIGLHATGDDEDHGDGMKPESSGEGQSVVPVIKPAAQQ